MESPGFWKPKACLCWGHLTHGCGLSALLALLPRCGRVLGRLSGLSELTVNTGEPFFSYLGVFSHSLDCQCLSIHQPAVCKSIPNPAANPPAWARAGTGIRPLPGNVIGNSGANPSQEPHSLKGCSESMDLSPVERDCKEGARSCPLVHTGEAGEGRCVFSCLNSSPSWDSSIIQRLMHTVNSSRTLDLPDFKLC